MPDDTPQRMIDAEKRKLQKQAIEPPTPIRGFVDPPGLSDDPDARRRYLDAIGERRAEAAQEPLTDLQERYGLDAISGDTIVGPDSESIANKEIARLYRGYHAATGSEKEEFAKLIRAFQEGRFTDVGGGIPGTRGAGPFYSERIPDDDFRYGDDLREAKQHYGPAVGQKAIRSAYGMLPDELLKTEQIPRLPKV